MLYLCKIIPFTNIIIMKRVLYVLLSHFAEHEMPYLTQPLRSDAMSMKEHPKFENRIVAESIVAIHASQSCAYIYYI